MSLSPSRLLGFAFASADLMVELDGQGRVVLAIGVAPEPGAEPNAMLGGKPLADACLSEHRQAVSDFLAGMTAGTRAGPLDLVFQLKNGRTRRGSLRAFRLPDLAPAVSCAISYRGEATASAPAEILDGDGFEARVAQVVGRPPEQRAAMDLTFVDVSGLADVDDAAVAARLGEKIEGLLQALSLDGSSAARLGDERFALLKDPKARAVDIEGEIREAGADEGIDLTARATTASIEKGSDPLATLRALRYAVDGFLRSGEGQPELAFTGALMRTLKEADAFRSAVSERRFDLHYQPIVDLRTWAVHHFEALARFQGDSTPAPMIRMAEEMALIGRFDLAVAEKAIQRLRAPGGGLLKIAVNMSGAALNDDSYAEQLLRMTATQPEHRKRLMLEVTETATLADTEAAAARLSVLRSAGFSICIDDFGAGAASFDYLRSLPVDGVKIDGRFVADIDADPKAKAMVRHLTELCDTLSLWTVAEMIETESAAEALKTLGVGFGQGWLFGKAEKEPRTNVSRPGAGAARRRGEVEAWG